MRFRRRITLFPGVTLNLSKTGISTRVGIPGASLNFGKQGTFLNTGIPETGLYDRKRIGNKKSGSKTIEPDFRYPDFQPMGKDPFQKEVFIQTENVENITTEELQSLRENLLRCFQEKNELKREIAKSKSELLISKAILTLSYIFIIGFLIKWFKQNRKDKIDFLNDLENQFSKCFVDIDIQTESIIEQAYLKLIDNYKVLLTCNKIWDITSKTKIDNLVTRSSASENVTRKLVKFDFGNFEIIKSKYEALHFENANGGDLYIYPAFVVVVDNQKKFGLIDIRELKFKYGSQRFLEEQGIPPDSKVVDHTWAKVNKNGSPDKRFKGNYQIPVCLYGEIELKSATGLNEAYSFSSNIKTQEFGNSFSQYKELLSGDF